MHAVNPIHVRIAAIRIQEPPIFVAETFLGPAYLCSGESISTLVDRNFLRERARQRQHQPVVVNVREKMRIFRQHVEDRNVETGISGFAFKLILSL